MIDSSLGAAGCAVASRTAEPLSFRSMRQEDCSQPATMVAELGGCRVVYPPIALVPISRRIAHDSGSNSPSDRARHSQSRRQSRINQKVLDRAGSHRDARHREAAEIEIHLSQISRGLYHRARLVKVFHYLIARLLHVVDASSTRDEYVEMSDLRSSGI